MPDNVVFRALAEADIESIGDRFAQDSKRHAADWIADMRQCCATLAEFPARWPVYSGEIRRMVVGNYLVFFRIADPDIPRLCRVIVIRVMHGARNVEEMTDPGS